MITQNDLKIPIDGCENFYWSEALWQRDWDVFVFPTPLQRLNIVSMANIAERIREDLGNKAMIITSWLRIQAYNEAIGGARDSAHLYGQAIDFVVPGMKADDVREALLPRLEKYDLRMEKLPGSNWVHIDTRPLTGDRRYFIP